VQVRMSKVYHSLSMLVLFTLSMAACQSLFQSKNHLPDQWWYHLQGEWIYMLMCGGATLNYVIDEVAPLYESGYRVINVFVPYHGELGEDAPPSYCGLAPIDYYNVDPKYGTNEEWTELIEKAHAQGMAVIMWLNLGYTSLESDYWAQAQQDKINGIASVYVESFVWSDSGEEPLPEWHRWIYDDYTDWYYAASWGKNPQYDWSSSAWHAEAEKVLRHWLDSGVDGFVLDAVGYYTYLTPEVERQILTNIPADYGNKFVLPESAGEGHPEYWIGEQGYTHVWDNIITDWDGETAVTRAIKENDPSYLPSHFQTVRNQAVSFGGGTYAFNGPRWGNHQKHVLETAVHVGAGIHYQQGPKRLIFEYFQEINQIFMTSNNNPAFAPGADRVHMPTNDDHKYFAHLLTSMDQDQHVLCIYNFQDSEQVITVDLSIIELNYPITAMNLIDGENQIEIQEGTLSVTLPKFDFVFLEIP